jgi:hypothetical protein
MTKRANKHAHAMAASSAVYLAPAPRELALRVAVDARAMAEITTEPITQVEIDALGPGAGFAIPDDFTFAFLSTELAKRLAERDRIEALKKSVTDPIKQGLKTVASWFDPELAKYSAFERAVKAALIVYDLAKTARARAALAEASAAVQAGAPHEVVTRALVVANAPQAAAEGLSIRKVWRATIIAPDMLTREWLIPDEKKIDAHARACPADRAPYPIPGVKFELDGIAAQRR